jgi:CheY-like chemotaxis protein
VADPGQIRQVFQNLLINAIQAMPAGGTIKINAVNSHLDALNDLSLHSGNYVKIAIQDQGIGIPPEYLHKIFDPYFTTKQAGSGLGLATTYSIIKSHEGHISVKSKLGKGTTFQIYLPASAQTASGQLADDHQVATGKGNILVMDDEEMVRDVIGLILDNLGYKANLAKDGKEAVKKFTEAQGNGDRIDLVILDLTVPGGMGGKECLQQLRLLDPNIKAIVSSGYSDDPVMADFKKYGFNGVIAKPYNVADLSKLLHELIN